METLERRNALKIHFHGGIEAIVIPLENGLRGDDVVWKCMQHIRDIVCEPSMDQSKKGAMYLPAFGLRQIAKQQEDQQNQIWLPYWHKFEEHDLPETQREYKFRVRYRPLGSYDVNSILGEYLFLQMKDDFLSDPSFPVDKLDKPDILFLLVINMLTPKEIPHKNSTVVNDNLKTRSLNITQLMSFNKGLSPNLRKSLKLDSWTYRYWVMQSTKENVQDFKKRGNMTLQWLKEKLHDIIVSKFPTYCCEVYQVSTLDESIESRNTAEVSALLRLDFSNVENNGLYYDEHLKCCLADIEGMTVVKPQNALDKVWMVLVLLNNGKPKSLMFKSESEAMSFLSMAQGLLKLCVSWSLLLNHDKDTLLSQRELTAVDLRSFGPLYNETAKDHLMQLSRKFDNPGRCFLIHQSMTDFGSYDLVICEKNQPTPQSQNKQISSVSLDLEDCFIFHYYRILHDLSGCNNAPFLVAEKDHGKQQLPSGVDGGLDVDWRVQVCGEFWSETELIRHLTKQLGMQQAQPVDYSEKADISGWFKKDIDPDTEFSMVSPALSRPVYVDEERLPSILLPTDLKHETVIEDKNIMIRKFKVHYGKRAMMKVQVGKNEKEAAAFREGLERLEKLRRFKPQRFLELYNIVLCRQLTLVFELAPLGDLLTYICEKPQKLRYKVDLITQVVQCLKVMYECQHYHGNIRSRKFLVFQDNTDGSLRLKMEYPGITSLLDRGFLDDPLNLERLWWLSPERQRNLESVTYMSECFAVGTTIAEILYRSDKFTEKLGHKDDSELKKYKQKDIYELPLSELPKPGIRKPVNTTTQQEVKNTTEGADCDNTREEGCGPPTADVDQKDVILLMSQADGLMNEMWDTLVLPCWGNADLRPLPQKLLAELEYFSKSTQDIVEEVEDQSTKASYEDIGMSENSPTVPLDKNSLIEELKKNNKDFIDLSQNGCSHGTIDLEWGKIGDLGNGHFGTVTKGKLKNFKGVSRQDVAIKQLKIGAGSDSTAIMREFCKEIKLSSELNDDYIVRVLAAGSCNSSNSLSDMVLITEYMNNGSLDEYLNKCNLNIEETVNKLKNMCVDIVKGMRYLSGKNIVHRDLAPRNVLLTDYCMPYGRLRAKVADFGLARPMEENYRFYRVKGTTEIPWPVWPPEVLSCLSDGKFTSKGDVWSFGILLWQMFTKGSVVREISNLLKIELRRHSKADEEAYKVYKSGWRPPKKEAVTFKMYEIMKDCWKLKPEERPFFVDLEHRLTH